MRDGGRRAGRAGTPREYVEGPNGLLGRFAEPEAAGTGLRYELSSLPDEVFTIAIAIVELRGDKGDPQQQFIETVIDAEVFHSVLERILARKQAGENPRL